MAWFSILPSNLAGLETWLVQFFLLLGFITIGPWLAFLLYDLVYYVLRTILHEIPLLGGRAQGAQRPRAPSLTVRDDGKKRRFSIAAVDDVVSG